MGLEDLYDELHKNGISTVAELKTLTSVPAFANPTRKCGGVEATML